MLSRGWARYLPWRLGALAAGLLTLPIVLHQCSASREGAATMVLAEAQRLGASWVASHPTAPEAPSRQVLPAQAVEWSVEPGAAAAMLRFAGSLSAEQMQLMAAQRPMEESCFAAEQRRQLALAVYYAVGRGYGPPERVHIVPPVGFTVSRNGRHGLVRYRFTIKGATTRYWKSSEASLYMPWGAEESAR